MPFDPYYKWLGIPPDEQPPNHYRLLGLRLLESDRDVIDAAANRQMAYVQQCATGPHAAESQRLLNELSAARLCLLSAAEKQHYDVRLKTPPAERDMIGPAAAPALRTRVLVVLAAALVTFFVAVFVSIRFFGMPDLHLRGNVPAAPERAASE